MDHGGEGGLTEVSSNPPQTVQLEKQRNLNRNGLYEGSHTNSGGVARGRKYITYTKESAGENSGESGQL